MASTPQRGATPHRAVQGSSHAASALLVPVTVARPSSSRLAGSSSSRSPSKTSNYNDMDKENNNNNNTTPSRKKTMKQYDAFMSPLKSAMKAYPVLSPFKPSSSQPRRSISWTSREFTYSKFVVYLLQELINVLLNSFKAMLT